MMVLTSCPFLGTNKISSGKVKLSLSLLWRKVLSSSDKGFLHSNKAAFDSLKCLDTQMIEMNNFCQIFA